MECLLKANPSDYLHLIMHLIDLGPFPRVFDERQIDWPLLEREPGACVEVGATHVKLFNNAFRSKVN